MSESGTRGILTDSDKEYLKGEKEYEHRQSEADKRANIRERVAEAMKDFELLVEHWSTDEREKTMEEIDVEQRAEEMIAFLYIATSEYALDLEHMLEEGASDRGLAFRRALCRGIRRGKERFDDDPPERVLVDSNTKLYEIPSEGELQEVIDEEHWREVNQESAKDVTEQERIPHDRGDQSVELELRMALDGEVERQLYRRRQLEDSEINRHETYPRARGYFSEDSDNSVPTSVLNQIINGDKSLF